MRIILASESPYKAELLKRIIPDFSCQSPSIDESPKNGETPEDICKRLAGEKAAKIAALNPDSLVIACDQVAVVNTTPPFMLSKPGHFEAAKQQLSLCSNQSVTYKVACSLINTENNAQINLYDEYSLQFRALSEEEISSYLEIEQPFDCAGSIKSEGLGIRLIKSHHGTDPSTLVGLPLIALTEALLSLDIDPLKLAD